MKRTGIILSTLIFALSLNAHGVDLCIKISTENCTTLEDSRYTERTITCGGSDVHYKLLSICADQAGSSNGESAIDIEQSHSEDGGGNCWCKILSPIYTPWVFYFPSTDRNNYNNTKECETSCSGLCATKIHELVTYAQ